MQKMEQGFASERPSTTLVNLDHFGCIRAKAENEETSTQARCEVEQVLLEASEKNTRINWITSWGNIGMVGATDSPRSESWRSFAQKFIFFHI